MKSDSNPLHGKRMYARWLHHPPPNQLLDRSLKDAGYLRTSESRRALGKRPRLESSLILLLLPAPFTRFFDPALACRPATGTAEPVDGRVLPAVSVVSAWRQRRCGLVRGVGKTPGKPVRQRKRFAGRELRRARWQDAPRAVHGRHCLRANSPAHDARLSCERTTRSQSRSTPRVEQVCRTRVRLCT
jgi:hypothetical protein